MSTQSPLRRALMLGAASILTVSAVSACAPSGDSGDGDGVTLTVWSWRPEDVDSYNKIFDVFEESHPGITVEFKAFKATEYNQILATGLAGSEGPDVPQVRSFGDAQPTIAAGLLLPLDDDIDLSSWDPALVASALGKEDGKLYSVPLARQMWQMYYNADIFDELGLSVPTTWDEFVDVNQALLDADLVPMALGGKDSWTLPLTHEVIGAARFGGTDYAERRASGETTFEDPDWIASTELFTELRDFFPKDTTGITFADAQALFTSELAGMFPGGAADLATLQSANPDLSLGVFQVPAAPGSPEGSGPTTANWADGNFGVSSKTEHPEEALELVKWMTTPEFGQMVADDIKQISAVPGVDPADPVLREMNSLANESGSPYLLYATFCDGSPCGITTWGSGLQELFLGSKDAATISRELDESVASWFTPSK